MNKTFPLLYVIDAPEVNTLLLFESDFNKYKKPFPDSLNWVKDYDISN